MQGAELLGGAMSKPSQRQTNWRQLYAYLNCWVWADRTVGDLQRLQAEHLVAFMGTTQATSARVAAEMLWSLLHILDV